MFGERQLACTVLLLLVFERDHHSTEHADIERSALDARREIRIRGF
jgi:hypothetical protein